MGSSEDKLKKILSKIKSPINEGRISYPEGMNERMLPKLEQDLAQRNHSLGDHPIFPASDEMSFEQKIISKRFKDVVDKVKRHYNVETVDSEHILSEMMGSIQSSMQMEQAHKTELEELAVKMIREEYDMGEDDVDIIVELVSRVDMEGTRKHESPIVVEDMEFNNHDDIEKASGEVYKRRFVNAMIQGAAKKCNHMFHQVDEELTQMDPRMITQYNKMMSAADYAYYAVDNIDHAIKGGMVRIELPRKEGDKPLIHAQAMVFPVLIHELVKGVMELLSTHGLPEDPKMREYVIAKSDFLSAEPWDMRLGPGIWEKITENIDAEDFNIKHHIYSELCALPVDEFNSTMKEIMAGTTTGKGYVKDLVTEIKSELDTDDKDAAVTDFYNEDDGYSPDELDGLDFDDFL
jgi:hypothetical protein